MRLSPGLAIGWQFWRRNRVGVVASAATLLMLAAVVPVAARSTPLAGRAIAAVLAAVPAGFVVGFFMNALLYADEQGNLASGYPRRSFTLPLPTRSLVVWPMVYAASAVMLLWLVTAGLIFRPLGFRLPLVLPGAAFVAAMAWLQAVTWCPLGVVWLRIVAAVVVLAAVVVPAGLLKEAGVGDGWGILLLAAEAAFAFVVACVGVERERRGEVWRPSFGGALAKPFRRQPERFRSAAAAQAWYERRSHGMILPTFAAVNGALLVGVGLFSAAAGRGEAVTTLTLCGAILGLGAMAATSLGGTAARTQPLWVREKRPLPFVMIRPHTSGAIAAAKLRMLARAACVTTAVAVGCSAVLAAADGGRGLAEVWRILVARGSAGTAAAVLLLAAVLYPSTVWR